ncbi:MAG: choice-of-anchor Q domain-containing protein [Panacagrimonas sp.]
MKTPASASSTRLPNTAKDPAMRLTPLAAALAAGLFAMPQSANAATIAVVDGGCTLIDAITAANTNAPAGLCGMGSGGSDTITLPAGSTQTLVSAIGDNGLPVITSAITVIGNDSTIVRAPSSPAFRIFAVNGNGSLTLQRTTLSGGSAASNGGAIYSAGGAVALTDSTLSGNSAGSIGGAVLNVGGSLTMSGSTVSGNFAGLAGGGIASLGGAAAIVESTVSGNTAGSFGGGIYGQGGAVTLIESTVTGNNGGTFGGGVFPFGGFLDLNRSLISGNTASNGAELYSFFATVDANNFNVFGFSGSSGTNAAFTPGPLDIVPTVALPAILGLLANNGGPTLTHALTTGSPAINAVGTSCFPKDQRGVNRPKNVKCDIGAFEVGVNTADLAITKTPSDDSVLVGESVTFNLGISNAGPENATDVQVFDTLPPELSFVSATPTQGSCVLDLGTVTCNLGGLASGGLASISLVTTASTPGTADNTASVISAPIIDSDPNTANNEASASVEIVALDTTPDQFTFLDQTNVALNSLRTSNTVTITGINTPTPISVSGGMFSIGCTGTFTATASVISSGQTVCVQHTSSGSFSTAVNTTLTVGGVSDTFTSTTLAADTTPDQFMFTDVTNVALNSVQTSNAVTITDINTGASISVSGGMYSIGCTGTFTAAVGTINSGETVCVRHTASGSVSTATNTTLTVGGVSDTFTSNTLAADTTPNVFVFIDQTNVPRSTVRTSNTVTIAGIDTPAPISVVGGGYSVGCTGTFTSAAGTINSGQTVCVRHTSANAFNAGVNTILTVGGVSDTFSSVTAPNTLAALLGVVFKVIPGLVGSP